MAASDGSCETNRCKHDGNYFDVDGSLFSQLHTAIVFMRKMIGMTYNMKFLTYSPYIKMLVGRQSDLNSGFNFTRASKVKQSPITIKQVAITSIAK